MSDPLHLSYNNLAPTTDVCGNAMSVYIHISCPGVHPSPQSSALYICLGEALCGLPSLPEDALGELPWFPGVSQN